MIRGFVNEATSFSFNRCGVTFAEAEGSSCPLRVLI